MFSRVNVELMKLFRKLIENDVIYSREVNQRVEIDKLNYQLVKMTNDFESTMSYKARRIYGILPKSPVFYLRIFFFCLLTGSPPAVDVMNYNHQREKKKIIVGSSSI